MKDHDQIEFGADSYRCPIHDGAYRKVYVYGSTMSTETEVVTFRGCCCAVSISHDPVGTYPSVARYHTSFNSAAGTGRLRALDAAAKYR
jgi:hypothetical protein